MRRGTALKIAAAVIIVLLTGSSAWAAETWQQLNVSRNNFQTARAQAERQLSADRRDGMRASVVRDFKAQVSRVAVHASSSPSSWPATLAFYKAATRRLIKIKSGLARELERETQQQRTRALEAVGKLSATISRAEMYQVSSEAATARAGFQARIDRAATPAQLAAITVMANRQRTTVAREAARAETFVDKLVRTAGSKSGVIARATTTVASTNRFFMLLGVLTNRVPFYRQQEARALSAVAAAPDVFSSAVAEYKLDRLAVTVAQDFDKSVPTKLVVVSTESQSVTLYQNGQPIYSTVATTGGPELPTFHGVYHIYEKISPFVFHSPFPLDSPYYYPPSPVSYWMPFDGGQGLHDAPWRSNFGPGSNFQPTDLGGGRSILGTHGCVNLPFAAAQYLWNWAPLGTTVAVI